MYARRMMTFLIIIIIPIMLTSCLAKQIINQNGFIQTITVDKTDTADIYRIGIMFPDPEKGSTQNALSLSIEAENLPKALDHFQLKTRYSLVIGQLRNIIISRELAESVGVNKIIQTLLYNPKFPLTSRIMIHNGKASDYLKLKEDLTDYHLSNLVKKMQNQYKTGTNTLFNFVRNELEPGVDPILLQSHIEEGSAGIEGALLFIKDKPTSMIDEQELQYLLMLRNKKMNVNLNISKAFLPTNQPFAVNNAIVKKEIRILQVKPIPKFEIYFSIIGPLVSPINDITDHSSEITSDMIERSVEHDLNQFVRKVQASGADPIGIGQLIRNKMAYEEWNEDTWREMFKKADIRCIVQYTLENEI
ncbi:Ger(x)C family spore germination protein [Paenibacillus aquistagni]|uniref:Ger(x)C family spore germination protein n=1 Tax=Paenibacillus aquistagni TaxID=1852522 RepID=UPI000B5072D0|nr:Ger(x)C family spore germination C-terminal domain-containing protein [Paenibacillus aquistagni]